MNGSVKPGYPHAEERNWTLISHHIQKSTQNRLGLNIRPETTIRKHSETTIRKHISIFIIMLETQATKAKKKKKWDYIRLKTSSQ